MQPRRWRDLSRPHERVSRPLAGSSSLEGAPPPDAETRLERVAPLIAAGVLPPGRGGRRRRVLVQARASGSVRPTRWRAVCAVATKWQRTGRNGRDSVTMPVIKECRLTRRFGSMDAACRGRLSPSHGRNVGSNPAGITTGKSLGRSFRVSRRGQPLAGRGAAGVPGRFALRRGRRTPEPARTPPAMTRC